MLTIRKNTERGVTKLDWLDSHHSFCFGQYYDPAHSNFGALRVINEDRVAPGAGFGTHPHSNMEILTWVLEGALAHKDSMGNQSVIQSGDVQLISAGSGITHSEFNPSEVEATHFLQIWITPAETDTTPDYQQRSFPGSEMRNQLRIVASPDGEQHSLKLKQQVRIFAGVLAADFQHSFVANVAQKYWLQVVRGDVLVNSASASMGDGIAIEQESKLNIQATSAAEILLFELPA